MAGHALFSLLLTCMFLHAHAACQFPQDNFSAREWAIRAPDYTLLDYASMYKWRILNITDNIMKIDYVRSDIYTTKRIVRSVTYICQTAIPATADDSAKYVITKQQEGVADINTCVQFVNRSNDIFQLKWGTQGVTLANNLCDSLTLSGNLLTPAFEDIGTVVCPLTGGFLMKAYSSAGYQHCETGYPFASPRLESNCRYAGNMEFSKTYTPCGNNHFLPNAFSWELETLCGATWTEGENTFSVIVPDNTAAGIACMRYPTNHGDTFTAYLYNDEMCDNTANNDLSEDYTKLELSKYAWDNLCGNGDPACVDNITYWCPSDGYSIDNLFAEVCRESCQTCVKEDWGNAVFQTSLRGEWTKNSFELGEEVVSITNNTINIPNLGKYNLFGEFSTCTLRGVPTYLLYQTQDNGCAPRYSLIEIITRSDDVISYRISVSFSEMIYPDIRDICNQWAFNTFPERDTNHQFQGINGWSNLVRTNPKPVSCPTDSILFQSYDIALGTSGEMCNVEFDNIGTQKIKLSDHECTKNGTSFEKDLDTEFTCLASFEVKSTMVHDTIYTIVSAPTDSPIGTLYGPYICFLFSFEHNRLQKGYWLPISSCTAVYILPVENGKLQPYAEMTPMRSFNIGSSVSYRNEAHLLVVVLASVAIINWTTRPGAF